MPGVSRFRGFRRAGEDLGSSHSWGRMKVFCGLDGGLWKALYYCRLYLGE